MDEPKCSECGKKLESWAEHHDISSCVIALRDENEAYRARVIADGKLFEESSELLKRTLAENERLRTAIKKLRVTLSDVKTYAGAALAYEVPGQSEGDSRG